MELSDLSCPLCSKLYNRDTRCPRILPCGHTFCHLCLSELFTHRVIRCPEDRTSLAVRKAAELPQNHTVLRLAIKAAGSQPHLRCADHSKPLEYFCLEDRAKICASCGLMGRHKGHRIQTEEDLNREFDLRIEVLCDFVAVIQAALESGNEELREERLQALFEQFVTRKSSLESSLKATFALIRQQVSEAEKKAHLELRRSCEKIESVFSQLRDGPAEVAKELLAVKNEVRALIDSIDSGKDPLSALEAVAAEAERLLPKGERALTEMENEKTLPQLLEDLIPNLDIDVDALTLECISKAINVRMDETLLLDTDDRSLRTQSVSEMMLPAPAPLNEERFTQVLEGIIQGTTESADFSSVGGVGDRAVQVAPFLLANDSIKKLRFANNQLTSLSLCSLFKAIEGNESLEDFELEKNTLDSEVCDKLLSALRTNETLKRISLKGCWVGQNDASRLLASDPRVQF